jgi:hypothetical protein
MVIKCKIAGFDNLITIYGGEKNITRKTEKHDNETYLLFAYHPTTTIILQQLPTYSSYYFAHIVICKLEKKTHNHL